MINKDNSISTKIKLSCKLEGHKTLLADSYCDIPYKIVHYGSKLLHDHLEIMMMCYSPGVMDGDQLDIDVECPPGTDMRLFTQSFNKLHPMKKGAGQTMKVQVGDGAMFQFLPHPTIPFKNSIFNTVNEVSIEKDAHLIWGDIISGGRIHSGEKFQFTTFHSHTKIYHNHKLIFFDNQLLAPRAQPVQELLFFEGYTHQGTLLIVSPYAAAFKVELDDILLEQFTDMSYGFTQCAPNALLIRVLGESGDALHDWLANISDMCRSFIKHHTGKKNPVIVDGNVSVSKPKKALAKKKSAPKKVPPKKRVKAKA